VRWGRFVADAVFGPIAERPSADVASAPAALPVAPKATMTTGTVCPYCNSTDFVKRGIRQKKHEAVQLYLCRNAECGRTFTAERVKGKRFPLNVILEGISYYNLGLSLEQTCELLGKKFGNDGENGSAPGVASKSALGRPTPATLASWVEEYKPICRFERMRPYAIKLFPPAKMIEVTTMAHRQLYRFRYHRAKTLLSMEEFKNRRFGRLKEYLEHVSSETPHQYFADGERMSEIRSKFDKTDMIVKSKHNFANDLAEFVLRSVTENKDRHEALQRFMIANDSVTVATEVPVYIRKEDVEHMENILKFKIVGEDGLIEMKGDKQPRKFPKLLTGHIDIVQIRNGMVHILDYKPNASKEKPIEQLTWYALALSRLTGLRLFEFKCAWFDDKDFYEFYPLHIVKKLQTKKRARKVHYRDGSVAEVPREDVFKVA
jgi:transposase-like protein